MPMEELKKTLGEIGKAFEDYKATNDKRLAEMEETGTARAETTAQLAKIDERLDALKDVKDKIEALENTVERGRYAGGGTTAENAAKAEHTKAFDAWFRKGVEGNLKSLEVQAGLFTESDPDGGFLVPEEMSRAINELATKKSAMRSLATVMSIGTDSYSELFDLGGTTSGWVGETEARGKTKTPTVAEIAWNAKEIYAKPQATQKMLDDSYISIETWLGNSVAKEFSRQEGIGFMDGNGVKQPFGLAKSKFADDANWQWGSFGFIGNGSTTLINTDALIDMQTALATEYMPNGVWLMNRKTQAEIRKLKDTEGNYIWQPTLTAGIPNSLLGYPVQIDDFMTDIAANKYPVYFGDFKEGYLIVDRFGIRVLRDPYSNKPWVEFYTTKRVGGGPRNYEAIKALKMAA